MATWDRLLGLGRRCGGLTAMESGSGLTGLASGSLEDPGPVPRSAIDPPVLSTGSGGSSGRHLEAQGGYSSRRICLTETWEARERLRVRGSASRSWGFRASHRRWFLFPLARLLHWERDRSFRFFLIFKIHFFDLEISQSDSKTRRKFNTH